MGVGTTATYLLEEVKVLNKGAGYGTSTTSITVLSPRSEVKLRTNVQQWTINLFEKYYQG